MRAPLEWINEFAKTNIGIDQIVSQLEMAGIVVDSVNDFGNTPVLDLEITPNRSDWLNIFGIAREIAALTQCDLEPLDEFVSKEENNSETLLNAVIEDTNLCSRYAALLVAGINIQNSPSWLINRLEACGIRPVNNIVDITNYVLLEQGQPLHAFDFDKLNDNSIKVRCARNGENISTLDGCSHDLTPEMLVIADASKPVAIAGIIGGSETEVSETTQNILIESAHFDPISIRTTSKRLGIRTEASYRFERGVDPNGTLRAVNRAAFLISKLSESKINYSLMDIYPNPISPETISLLATKIKRNLGIDVDVDKAADLLNQFGFDAHPTTKKSHLSVNIPTFRQDLRTDNDLVEEIARIYGYNNIPTTTPTGAIPKQAENSNFRVINKLKEVLSRMGLKESLTFSLTEPRNETRWGWDNKEALELRNPLTTDFTRLRTSLLPSILNVLERNVQRGNFDMWTFEIGKIYKHSSVRHLPDEFQHICIGLMGENAISNWDKHHQPADFFTVKGMLVQILNYLGIESENCEWKTTSLKCLHPHRSSDVFLNGDKIACVGEIHPKIKKEGDFTQNISVVELFLHKILIGSEAERYLIPLPSFPSATRDIAIVVDEKQRVEEVTNIINFVGKKLVESVMPFDEFHGDQIESGKKSVAINITFRAEDKTLQSEEIDELLKVICKLLKDSLGAEIRK